MTVAIKPLAIPRRSGKRRAPIRLIVHPDIHFAPRALNIRLERAGKIWRRNHQAGTVIELCINERWARFELQITPLWRGAFSFP